MGSTIPQGLFHVLFRRAPIQRAPSNAPVQAPFHRPPAPPTADRRPPDKDHLLDRVPRRDRQQRWPRIRQRQGHLGPGRINDGVADGNDVRQHHHQAINRAAASTKRQRLKRSTLISLSRVQNARRHQPPHHPLRPPSSSAVNRQQLVRQPPSVRRPISECRVG